MVRLLNSCSTLLLQLCSSTAGGVRQQQHMAWSTAMTELGTMSQAGSLHCKPCSLVPAVVASSHLLQGQGS